MEGNVLLVFIYSVKTHEHFILSKLFWERAFICSVEAEGAKMHIIILNSWLVILL